MKSISERIGLKSIDSATPEIDSEQMGYAWVPPGLISASKVNFLVYLI